MPTLSTIFDCAGSTTLGKKMLASIHMPALPLMKTSWAWFQVCEVAPGWPYLFSRSPYHLTAWVNFGIHQVGLAAGVHPLRPEGVHDG